MKRIKMMLLSLALFAVVGGALAFKAKFEQTFCTAPTVSSNPALACLNQACPTSISGVQVGGDADFVCTTVFDEETGCENAICSTPSVRITEDDPQ